MDIGALRVIEGATGMDITEGTDMDTIVDMPEEHEPVIMQGEILATGICIRIDPMVYVLPEFSQDKIRLVEETGPQQQIEPEDLKTGLTLKPDLPVAEMMYMQEGMVTYTKEIIVVMCNSVPMANGATLIDPAATLNR